MKKFFSVHFFSIIAFLFVFLVFETPAFAACNTYKVCTAFNTCSTISGINYQPPGPPSGDCPACNNNVDCIRNNYFLPGAGGTPNTFWGIVTNCGTPVAAGSYVDAKVCNGNMQRDTVVDCPGGYGIPAGNRCYGLAVPGNTQCSINRTGGANGDPVNFWVNGRAASLGWNTTFTFGASTRWDVGYCVPSPTPTPKPTATNTPKPTNTPIPTPTNTPKPTNTPIPTPTNTPIPTPTNTPIPTPTSCPTANPVAVTASGPESTTCFSDRVNINWSAVTGATGYKVYRGVTYCATLGPVTSVTILNTDSSCGSMTPGSSYQFKVTVLYSSCPESTGTTDTGGVCALPTNTPIPTPTSTSVPTPTSTSIPTPTPTTALCSISSVSASDGTFSDRINISWSANNPSQADRIDVYEGGSYLTSVTTSTFSYTRSGLSCGVSSTYTIYCSKGGVPYGGLSDVGSTASCPTPTPIPPTPTSISTPAPTNTPIPTPTSTSIPTPTPTPVCPSCPAVGISNIARGDGTYNAYLQWPAVANAEGIKIYRCSGAGCNPSASLLTTLGAGATDYTDNNNNNGFGPGTWVYEVRPFKTGCSVLNCTDYTNTIILPTATPTITPTSTPIPCVPADPDQPDLTLPTDRYTYYTNTVNLTWDAISNWNDCSPWNNRHYNVYLTNDATHRLDFDLSNDGEPPVCDVDSTTTICSPTIP